MMVSKRRKVLEQLSALSASNPEVLMVSTLDLEAELPGMKDATMPLDEEDEECTNAACNRRVAKMRAQISDLNQQVDTLSDALKSVTRRYRVLDRRPTSKGAARLQQVTKKLLSSLGQEEESGAPDEPSPESPGIPPSTHEETSDTQPPSITQPSSVPRALRHRETNLKPAFRGGKSTALPGPYCGPE